MKGLIRFIQRPIKPLVVSPCSVASAGAVSVLSLLLLLVTFSMILPLTRCLSRRRPLRASRPHRGAPFFFSLLRLCLLTFWPAGLALCSCGSCSPCFSVLLLRRALVSTARLLRLLLDRRRRRRRWWCLLGHRLGWPLGSSTRSLGALEAAGEISQRPHRPNKMLHLLGDQVAQRARVPGRS